MKRIFFITVLLLSLNFYAQPPGGGGGRRSQGQESQFNKEQKVKEFSASDAAGVFYYDIEEVIKKLKIKDEKHQDAVTKALKDYNFKIKEISFLNSQKFSDIDIAVKAVMKGNDKEAGMEMRKKVGELIRPIKEKVHENEKELNKILASVLSEKQQKKWLKYQKKKKESLQPKRLDKENREGARSNARRTRRQ